MIIAIPTQNAEPWKDYRSKEVAVYSGSDEISHSMEETTSTLTSSLHASSSLVEFEVMQISMDVKLIISEVDRYHEPEPGEECAGDHEHTPAHSAIHNTSWRSAGSPPCLSESTHGWVPVNTHSTPVLPKGMRLWVAHEQHK